MTEGITVCILKKKIISFPLIIKLLYTKALQVSRIYLQKSSCCFIKPHYLYFFSSDIPVHFGFLAGAKLPFCSDTGTGSSSVGALTPQPGFRALFPVMRIIPAVLAPELHPALPQKNTIKAEEKTHNSFISVVPTAILIAFN